MAKLNGGVPYFTDEMKVSKKDQRKNDSVVRQNDANLNNLGRGQFDGMKKSMDQVTPGKWITKDKL